MNSYERWSLEKYDWGTKIVDVQDVTIADLPQNPLDTWPTAATAADIVRAVNSHNNLVAAVRLALHTFEDLNDEEGPDEYAYEEKEMIEALMGAGESIE